MPDDDGTSRRSCIGHARRGPVQTAAIHIEISNGDVELRSPLSFGAAHVPAHFASLNGQFGYDDDGTVWKVDLTRLSWSGNAPDLTMESLTGSFANRAGDLVFDRFAVQTPRSAFVLNGGVDRTPGPAVFDLQVNAARFAFQEWSGILNGLKNIAVEAAFDAHLTGPLSKFAVDLNMRSNGGIVRGPFVLDMTVPGWHGKGTVDLERLDLGRWLNRHDRPSDISGRVEFDFALNLGHGLMFAPESAYFPELFGARVRFTGASFGFQASAAIGGGFAPIIATWLAAYMGGTAGVSVMLILLALITLIATFFAHETRDEPLLK